MRRIKGRLLGLILGVIILASMVVGALTFSGLNTLNSNVKAELLSLKTIDSIEEVISKVREVNITYYGNLNNSKITIEASYSTLSENETHIVTLFASKQDNVSSVFEVVFSKDSNAPVYIRFNNESISDPQLASIYLSRIVGLQFTPLSIATTYYKVLNGSLKGGIVLKLISSGETVIGQVKCKTWTYQVLEESSKEVEEYKVVLGDFKGYLVAVGASVKFIDGSSFNFNLTSLRLKG